MLKSTDALHDLADKTSMGLIAPLQCVPVRPCTHCVHHGTRHVHPDMRQGPAGAHHSYHVLVAHGSDQGGQGAANSKRRQPATSVMPEMPCRTLVLAAHMAGCSTHRQCRGLHNSASFKPLLWGQLDVP